jgi:F-type H+-transporting ATPase subunit delta
MTNPRLATRYAKSLVDLATEQNQLNDVYNDMLTLKAICKSNKDFVQLLKSPIIKGTTKQKIVQAVTDGRVGNLTTAFNQLLVSKGRESNLPEIADAVIEQYKVINNIKTVKLTTATPIDDNARQAIINKIGHEKIDLETVVDEKLIGGFVLQTGDQLMDASIAYDLKAIQKQFMNNDFIYKIK